MTTEGLLLDITRAAYDGDQMVLSCGVLLREWIPPDGLVLGSEQNRADDVARGETDTSPWTPPMDPQHVAGCQALCMTQAFGDLPRAFPPAPDNLHPARDNLRAARDHLTTHLESMDQADQGRPVPASCHGNTADNPFQATVQHRVSYSSQLVALRKVVEA